MTSLSALAATSSAGAEVIRAAEPISQEMAQKKMAEFFQMLTAEFHSQLKMLKEPRPTLMPVVSIEFRDGILLLKTAEGRCGCRKIPEMQMKRLRKAYKIFIKTHNQKPLKNEITETIKCALASSAAKIFRMGLEPTKLLLLEKIDFSECFQRIYLRDENKVEEISDLVFLRGQEFFIQFKSGQPQSQDTVVDRHDIMDMLLQAKSLVQSAADTYKRGYNAGDLIPLFVVNRSEMTLFKNVAFSKKVMDLTVHILKHHGVPQDRIVIIYA